MVQDLGSVPAEAREVAGHRCAVGDEWGLPGADGNVLSGRKYLLIRWSGSRRGRSFIEIHN